MEVKKKKKKKKYPNHGHDKQRQRLNESELEALRGGERSEKWQDHWQTDLNRIEARWEWEPYRICWGFWWRWRSWRCCRQSSALAPGQSLNHLLPAQQKQYTHTPPKYSVYYSCWVAGSWRLSCFVLVYLIVSQRVESFPVVVNLSCDIFILQDDSGYPTLTPFFEKRKAELMAKSTNTNCMCVSWNCVSLAIILHLCFLYLQCKRGS